MLRYVNYIWKKITPAHAIKLAGPTEKAFFEFVYRLVFLTGLSTSDDYLTYTIYSTFVKIICILVIGLETWHLVGDDLLLDDMIYSANVVSIHTISIWKHINMISHKKVFRKLAKALELPSFDISTQNRKDIVKYWANTHTKYLTVLLTIVGVGMTCWQTFPLLDELEYNFMVDVKLPYELTGYPLRFVLSYIAVGISFHYTSYMVVMVEVITQCHLIPIICQFDVLANCFENIFEECSVEFQASFPEINRQEFVTNALFVDKYLKRLDDLVVQHKAILAQTMDLKRILSAPMLSELACSGFLICCVGYQAIATFEQNLVKFGMSVLYLSYHMFSFYLICRWCEEITLQSQNIGQSAYFSGWESGISQAPGVRSTIMLVISRSNTPLVFVAGGMYPLSLSAYTNLVKASYSALNLLLTMDSSKET